MSQSLVQLYTHLIFSTKHREPFLDASVHEDLRGYLGGILRNLESPSLMIGCVADHVHILYSQSRKIALMDLVEEVKKSSSKWLKTKGPRYRRFYWQSGYGAFSVSPSRLGAVKRYIQNQGNHHRKVSFQDEFRRFLKEYAIEYDERYVWD